MKVIAPPLAVERAFEAATCLAGDKADSAHNQLEHRDGLEQFAKSGRVIPKIELAECRGNFAEEFDEAEVRRQER